MVPGVRLENQIPLADIAAAFYKYKGYVSRIAEALDVSTTTIYNKCNEFPELRQALNDARVTYDTEVLDLAEDNILKLLNRTDVSTTFFTLNTRGEKRGWHKGTQDNKESELKALLAAQAKCFEQQAELLACRNEIQALKAQLPAIPDKSESNDQAVT